MYKYVDDVVELWKTQSSFSRLLTEMNCIKVNLYTFSNDNKSGLLMTFANSLNPDQARHSLGTKIFQYCTCPAGRVTYNFHSSCKHMHLSFKSVCNKEHNVRSNM